MSSRHLLSSKMIRLVVVVAALVGCSSLGLRGAPSQRRAHLSADLARHQASNTTARTRIIVRGTDRTLDLLASRHRLRVVKRMRGAAVVLVNSAELSALSRDGFAGANLSGDLRVQTTTAISDASTAADQTRAGNAAQGLLGIPGVDGQGIGIAVIDSGIAPHSALANRVVANVSFVTGDPQGTDTFGHGTHVAGIIAGNPGPAGGVAPAYSGGIAPGARLINVKVLGPDGSGFSSDVIAGIEWVVANRALHNIRVINLSLGHPVMEACSTDPLCEAVKQAVQAGIVVVVAAGNAGQASDGRAILGGISSPGNSPYAITVGALNTWGTVGRSDDTVAAFSSRGPPAYDFAVKPDVAAPGIKTLSLQAEGAFLPAMHPSIHVAGSGNNAYMYLSGTSLAAPIVSGGVALLLQGSPNLSPAQVKFALQGGATPLAGAGLMGAGAGSVNFWAARQIAVRGPAAAQTSAGNVFWHVGSSATIGTGTSFAGNILAVASITVTTGARVTGRTLAMNGAVTLDTNAVTAATPMTSAVTTVGGVPTTAGGASFWDAGTLAARLQAGIGTRVLSAIDASLAWVSPSLLTFGDLNLLGLTNPLGSVLPKALTYGTVAGWTDVSSIAWGTAIQDPQGAAIVWGVSDLEADAIVWGVSDGEGDAIVWGVAILTWANPR